jgi:uncharacterized membrane protein YccC
MGLRRQLSASVSSAAGPYGYTISLGGATAMATGRLGSPGLPEALLMMLGAVVAFVVLEVAAQGSLMPGEPPQDRPPSIWGNAHVPSAGLALLAVWGLLRTVHSSVAWLLVGFAATGIYFVMTAVQRIALQAAVERLHGPHAG